MVELVLVQLYVVLVQPCRTKLVQYKRTGTAVGAVRGGLDLGTDKYTWIGSSGELYLLKHVTHDKVFFLAIGSALFHEEYTVLWYPNLTGTAGPYRSKVQ